MAATRSGGSPGAAQAGDPGLLPRVAVLGTGTMGGAMARSLLRARLRVDVWDRTPEAAARLTEAGAAAHAGPAQAVAHADVVITMLPDGSAVSSVAFDQGMLAALRPGAIWAQMGTIGVAVTRRLAGSVAAERPGVHFVDAPVSGTRQPAEAGRLVILASGPEAARPALAPVFGAIGTRTLWLGEAGAGSRLKLVLNTWLAFLMEGIAESAALADVLGVPHGALRDALRGGPLDSPIALAKLAKIDAADQSPDFSLRWAAKDVDLALAEAGDRVLPVAAIDRRWHELASAGLGGCRRQRGQTRAERIARDPLTNRRCGLAVAMTGAARLGSPPSSSSPCNATRMGLPGLLFVIACIAAAARRTRRSRESDPSMAALSAGAHHQVLQWFTTVNARQACRPRHASACCPDARSTRPGGTARPRHVKAELDLDRGAGATTD